MPNFSRTVLLLSLQQTLKLVRGVKMIIRVPIPCYHILHDSSFKIVIRWNDSVWKYHSSWHLIRSALTVHTHWKYICFICFQSMYMFIALFLLHIVSCMFTKNHYNMCTIFKIMINNYSWLMINLKDFWRS